ncbi:MAG: nitroreductase [Kangiellaceae bacterium]|nr:nitroreductase [Kangiellaceae bacterium]MCW8999761.1 nitroreductase [Kangiellaceae bacterium]
MQPIDLLLSRKSHNKLKSPGPTSEQLDVMFQAALRAPDHAMLRPWRYRIFEKQALEDLGDKFVRATQLSGQELSPEKIEKIRSKPLRAPMLIVASVVLQEHPKVPHIEQILSAGASVQNLLMAAHFQGVGAMWRTGDIAFNDHLMKLLDFEEDEIIAGFVYLGTEEGDKRKVKPFSISDFVTRFE